MAERPDWQPISRLPLIDAMLQDAEEHYQTLLQASPKPHVLDDYIVGRVFEVFGSQKNDVWLFEEQLARWSLGMCFHLRPCLGRGLWPALLPERGPSVNPGLDVVLGADACRERLRFLTGAVAAAEELDGIGDDVDGLALATDAQSQAATGPIRVGLHVRTYFRDAA